MGLRKTSLNEVKLEQYVAGHNSQGSRNIYKQTAQRMQKIVAEYGQRNTVDYLRGIAHNLSLQSNS